MHGSNTFVTLQEVLQRLPEVVVCDIELSMLSQANMQVRLLTSNIRVPSALGG